MAEQPFDPHVAALFADTPAFGDDGAFAARVERRLARRDGLRGLVVGGSGLVGAAVAAVSAYRLSGQTGVALDSLDRWMAWSAQPQGALWAAGGLALALLLGAVVVEEI